MPLLQRGTVLSSSMAQYGPVRPRMAKYNWPSMLQYGPVSSSMAQYGPVRPVAQYAPVSVCPSTAQYGPEWLSMSQYGSVWSNILQYGLLVCFSMLQYGPARPMAGVVGSGPKMVVF